MKKEFRVLMFIFLLNIVFSQIVGDDNLSRVILANKISTNQTIFLDEFKDVFIGDIIERNGHYVSSKSPGISFSLSLISYLINKLIPNNDALTFIKEDFRFRKLSISNLPISINIQSLIALILFSALPGSLLILFLEKYTKNIYISMLIYLASPLFPYSTTLFPYIFSIFLVTFAFIIRHKILTPILLGLSIFFDFTSIFLAFIVLFYLRRKVNVYYFLIGVFPSILYFLSFHDVFAYLFRLSNIDYYYFVSKQSSGYKPSLNPLDIISAIIYDLLKNSIFVLASLYRGIFIHFPLLILFFIYYRNFNVDIRKIALSSFVVYLIFNSLLNLWWGSLSFGPRYLIFSIPFIILSISSNWRVINKRIFYALVLLSIFINISSFTYWEGARKVIIEGKVVYITGFYKKGELVFEDESKLALTFPLMQHYLPSLIENGPRSRLLESFFTDRPLDLRYFFTEERDYITLIYNYPPYAGLLIILILTLLFFWSEIKSIKYAKISIISIIIFIIFYNMLHFGIIDDMIKSNKIQLKSGFYSRDLGGNVFAYKKAEIYIFSDKEGWKRVSFVFRTIENMKVNFLVNDFEVVEVNITKDYDSYISFPIYLKSGRNVLKIVSEKCIRPIEINESSDKRCLSLFFKSIGISEMYEGEHIFSEGWYPPENNFYPMGKEGRIYLFSNREVTKVLKIKLYSYKENRNISLFLNGKELTNFEASIYYEDEFLYPIDLKFGRNELKLVADKCLRPIDFGESADKRCLSIYVKSIEVLDLREEEPIFSEGWYPPENNFYPMGKEGRIKIKVYPWENKLKLIKIIASSYYEDRKVEVWLNGEKITDLIIEKYGDKEIVVPIFLKKRENELTLISNKCTRPIDVGEGDDIRCLSLYVKSLEILEGKENKPILSEIFLPIGNVYWIGKSGKIYVYSNKSSQYFLFLNITSFLNDRKVEIFFNSKLISSPKIFKEGTEIYIPIETVKGLNTVVINSKDCSIPSKEDKRCISVGIFNFTLIPIDKFTNETIMSEGWYLKTKDDDFKWGSDNVKLIYISENNATVTFYFDILTIYNETTKVEFYLNTEPKNIFEIAMGGGWVYTLPQKIRKGVNYLEFRVPRGCVTIDSILHNKDNRCIAMTLRGIMVKQ